ncbi:unnamed protein product [Somion occarium]|uniref:Glycoside hydrolase family 71 protein n=1 Tax=Somion occarium TaxID=3059160 RepID=A0ABP1DXM4_9APHY
MSAPRIPRSTRPKWIVAHFMVGNTYPYAVDDWQADIDLASDYGFDGFALNVGREDWQLARVADCFEAARRSLKPFKLFLSFDMASIPSGDRKDVALILGYLDRFARHPNYFVHASGIVVSTFAGQESFFGFPSLNEAWLHVKHAIEHCVKKPVHFIPSFFVDPRRYPSLTCMNGYFHWNGGWPLHLAPQSPRHEVHLPKLDSDQPHIAHLGRRTYMAAISPWFFTHYGRESWNKNWIYRSDDHLLIRRWEYLLSIRDDVDIVQFISWNDYGESHYISPPRGAQPNSQAWPSGIPVCTTRPMLAAYSMMSDSGFVSARFPKKQRTTYGCGLDHIRSTLSRRTILLGSQIIGNLRMTSSGSSL